MTVRGTQSWNPGFWVTTGNTYDAKVHGMPLAIGIKLKLTWKDLCTTSGKLDGPRAQILRASVAQARTFNKKIGLQILTTKHASTSILDSYVPDYVVTGPGGYALFGGSEYGVSRHDYEQINERTNVCAFWRTWLIDLVPKKWVQDEFLKFIAALSLEFGDDPTFDCLELTEVDDFLTPDAADAASTRTEVFDLYKKVKQAWPEVVLLCPWGTSDMVPADARGLALDLAREQIGIAIPKAQDGTLEFKFPKQSEDVLRLEGLCRQGRNLTAVAPTVELEGLEQYLALGYDYVMLYDHLVNNNTLDGLLHSNYVFWPLRCATELSSRFNDVQPVSIDGIRIGAACVDNSQYEQFDAYSVNSRRLEEARYYNLLMPEGWGAAQTLELVPNLESLTRVETRVNCGGPRVIADDGYVYFADTNFSGNPDSGVTGSFTNQITGLVDVPFHVPEQVSQSYRETTSDTPGHYIRYIEHVSPGQHRINLLFVEHAYETVGSRIFDYSIQVGTETQVDEKGVDLLVNGARYHLVHRTHLVTVGIDGRVIITITNGQTGKAILCDYYIEPNTNEQGIGPPVITDITNISDTAFLVHVTGGSGLPTGYKTHLNGKVHQSNAVPSDGLLPIINVQPNNVYSVQLSAYSVEPTVESQLSKGWTVTTPDLTPPSIPTGLSVTRDGEVTRLSWEPSVDAGSDISSYKVYRDDGVGGEFLFLASVERPSFFYTPDPVANYLYAVSAVDYGEHESGLSGAQGGLSWNHPPTAEDFTVEPRAIISVLSLANAQDADNDDLFIQDVGPIGGGLLTIAKDLVTLEAAYEVGYTLPRTAWITITDGRGGVKTINMTITPGGATSL